MKREYFFWRNKISWVTNINKRRQNSKSVCGQDVRDIYIYIYIYIGEQNGWSVCVCVCVCVHVC